MSDLTVAWMSLQACLRNPTFVGNQVRHISWNHSILSRPQQVGSSMPQGDSLSPRVLNLILAMPVRAVMRAEPDTQMVVFVDDRSGAASLCVVLKMSWSCGADIALGLVSKKTSIKASSLI